ncbi:MAG: hypothetical protein KF716_05130 [Anaerolineae bacterium]|nr:hypothetical protein [Anaerolineae bacterium]
MENQLTDLSFDDWVRYVFDHPVDHLVPEWYWQVDRDRWNETVLFCNLKPQRSYGSSYQGYN